MPPCDNFTCITAQCAQVRVYDNDNNDHYDMIIDFASTDNNESLHLILKFDCDCDCDCDYYDTDNNDNTSHNAI